MDAPRAAGDLEGLYLDARYACEALRARIRRSEPGAAERLREALAALCGELRSVLEKEGRNKVSRVFPRELLVLPLGELRRRCLEAAERLAGAGSPARRRLLAAVGEGAR